MPRSGIGPLGLGLLNPWLGAARRRLEGVRPRCGPNGLSCSILEVVALQKTHER